MNIEMNPNLKNLLQETALDNINNLDAFGIYLYIMWKISTKKEQFFTDEDEIEMCEKFHISRNKARRAFDYLVNSALI